MSTAADAGIAQSNEKTETAVVKEILNILLLYYSLSDKW